jgi:hypothetical protein
MRSADVVCADMYAESNLLVFDADCCCAQNDARSGKERGNRNDQDTEGKLAPHPVLVQRELYAGFIVGKNTGPMA